MSPSLFISWWWKWKATRHCTESQNTRHGQLPQKKMLVLLSSSTVPKRERTSNYVPVHAPCPRIHFLLQNCAMSFSIPPNSTDTKIQQPSSRIHQNVHSAKQNSLRKTLNTKGHHCFHQIKLTIVLHYTVIVQEKQDDKSNFGEIPPPPRT